MLPGTNNKIEKGFYLLQRSPESVQIAMRERSSQPTIPDKAVSSGDSTSLTAFLMSALIFASLAAVGSFS